MALLIPFVAQLALPPSLGPADVHIVFALGYLGATVVLLLEPPRRHALLALARVIRKLLATPSATALSELGRLGASRL